MDDNLDQKPPAPPAPEAAAAAAKPASRRPKPKPAAKEGGKVMLVMRTSRLADKDGALVARDRIGRCSEALAAKLIAADQARAALDYDVEDAAQPVADLAED